MSLKFILTFVLICSLSLASAQNSSKYLKAMEQESYTLYFVKPIALKNGKNCLVPDFTFQHGTTAPDEVELRFSLFSKTPIRIMDSLSLHIGEKTIGQTSGSELMFLEQAKGQWHARFNTAIPYPILLDMLKAGENLEVRFHSQESTLFFPANKKWKKMAVVVKEILSAEIGR